MGAARRTSSFLSPGQMIIAFIFSNILFLILGMAIGKGDFSSIPDQKPLPVETVTGDPIVPEEIEEFRSLEQVSKQEKKKHIDLNPRVTERKTTVEKKKITPEPRVQKTIKSPVSKKEPQKTKPRPSNQKTKGSFYLQLMASKNKEQINLFFQKVVVKGYPAKMVHEGSFYKIRLGDYPTREQAARMKTDIDKALKIQSWIKNR